MRGFTIDEKSTGGALQLQFAGSYPRHESRS